MAFNFTLDNQTYIERRLEAADESEARLDMVAAQSARKSVAIVEAVKKLEAVEAAVMEGLLPRASIKEMIAIVVSNLERANKGRQSDPTPEQIRKATARASERALAASAATPTGEGSR